RPRAAEMDARLHGERVVSRTRAKIVRPARLRDLPDGAMVRAGAGAALWIAGRLLPWSFAGYGAALSLPASEVELLTPPATVGVLAAGYRPMVHPRAGRDV